MLQQRIISALIGIPIIVAATWLGHPWYTTLIAVSTLWGLLELYSIAALTRQKSVISLGILLTLLFLVHGILKEDFAALLLSSGIILSLVWFLFRPLQEDAFANWAWILSSTLYLGWLMSYFLLLRDLPHGREWVLVTLFTTFTGDTAAYFIGRTWGKHYLAPRISPKKTREGAVAGLLGTIAAAVVLVSLFQLPGGWRMASLLGLLIGIFSQLGDLSESMLKRSLKVKHSSQTIPGHGGILDRLDSLLFTIVVVYYYVIWVIG